MGPYDWAWVVVALAVPLGLFALHGATRDLPWPRTKGVVAVLLAVWLLLPAPVPGFEGHYAPAFLVFAFEGVLQQSGHPRSAGLILAVGTLLAGAVMLLVAVVRGRRKGTR